MRFPIDFVATCLTAILCACSAAQSHDPRANPNPESASDGLGDRAGRVGPVDTSELGEVVQSMADNLWIVFQDKKGTRWFGSDGDGAFRVDGGRIVRYTTKDGLCNDHIRQILEDRAGNVYFHTSAGISAFDGQRFRTLVPIQRGNDLSAWKSEPDDLWFQGGQDDNGPYRFDGQTLHHLEFPKHELEHVFEKLAPNAPFSPYQVYTVFEDSRGSIWFGTSTLGVCRYDGRSLTWIFEDELTELDAGPSVGVRGIVEDRDGKFWFGNLLHRYVVDATGTAEEAKNSPRYRMEPGLVDPVSDPDAAHAYFMSGLKDRNGVVWIATYGAGVWRYDGEELTRYPVLVNGQSIRLFSIYEDQGGELWLGTQDCGAFRFDGTKFERFRP